MPNRQQSWLEPSGQPTVRVSQYEKAVQRWRESINDDAWTEHLDRKAERSRESRLDEAEARAADLLT